MKRLVSLVTLAALLVGCSRTSTAGASGQHSWTIPGELRIAIQQDAKNLNPLLSSNTTDVFIDRFMFEPLISANAKGDPVPILVTTVPTLENGGISRDGLTVTYHLRPNLKWTDGVPLTSRDVKFSWQAIMNPNNDVVSRHGYDVIRSIDTPNPTTVVVHLKQKFSPFVDTFFAESDQPFAIVPAHVLAKYPNINQIPFDGEPDVSDGPFRFAQWSRGDHIYLVRNDAFVLGKPKLKTIHIKIIPDENTSVNLLREHAIDYMFQASMQTYEAVRAIHDIKIDWVNVNGYYDIRLNLARPYLADPLVRRAIAYAIDKPELVKTLTYGTQTVATADIPDWMWAYNPNLHNPPHDVALARKLLAEAGWQPGPDGIARKDGHRLILVFVSDNSNATRRNETVLVKAMLKEVGIDAEIKYYPGDVLFAPAGAGGILQLGKYDISADGWFAGLDPDDSSQFLCQDFPPGGYNYSRYCSPEMQKWQGVALTHYDRATRKQAYAKIQELLMRDNPMIFLWWLRQLEPISVDFKGFAPNPVVESWNAWQWSI